MGFTTTMLYAGLAASAAYAPVRDLKSVERTGRLPEPPPKARPASRYPVTPGSWGGDGVAPTGSKGRKAR